MQEQRQQRLLEEIHLFGLYEVEGLHVGAERRTCAVEFDAASAAFAAELGSERDASEPPPSLAHEALDEPTLDDIRAAVVAGKQRPMRTPRQKRQPKTTRF